MLLVLENILSPQEVLNIRERLDQAQWESGIKTAGAIAAGMKSNEQLPDDKPTAIELGNFIINKLSTNPQFISAALPEKIYPPKFNRYANGAHYGVHIDSAIMHVQSAAQRIRSDLSATLFLCDAEDYEGGELIIEGKFGAQSVKLNAGDLILYPSSSLHQVTPVTRGKRVCSFFWIQSMVRDEGERELLYDLDQSIQSVRMDWGDQHPEVTRLSGIYHNLLRRWAVV